MAAAAPAPPRRGRRHPWRVRRREEASFAVSRDRMDPLRRFYRDEYDEDVRLTRSPHGRLEFARTVELLERELPSPPARVLDVGGGTGVHGRWLSAAGFDVVLVDLMSEHVARAAEIDGVQAIVGDARALPLET